MITADCIGLNASHLCRVHGFQRIVEALAEPILAPESMLETEEELMRISRAFLAKNAMINIFCVHLFVLCWIAHNFLLH